MGRTPAIQLAPVVWRIPTADLVNTFAFVDDDGQVTLVDAREAVRGFLRAKAGQR